MGFFRDIMDEYKLMKSDTGIYKYNFTVKGV